MELNLNENWKKTTAIDSFSGIIKPTGYEWSYRDIDRSGGVRIYHTLTEDCTWLHVNVHFVYQDSHEERMLTLNTRISSQDEFDNIIEQIHRKYERQRYINPNH